MDAILLVGGFGTRLLPLTNKIPKPLIPLANMPFTERTIAWLRDAGVDHVILSLHYNADHFEEYFTQRNLGIDISFAIEEEPLGTGGAIKNCERFLRSPRCLVFNGDIFTDLRLPAMLEAHAGAGARVSIALEEVDDPSRYGVIETDETRRILSFTEKPPREEAPSNCINAGIYIFERDIFDWFPTDPCSVERDIFPKLLQNGVHMLGYREPIYWTDLGTPADYLQAHRDILSKRVLVPVPCGEWAPGIWLGDNVDVAEDARIVPPVLIGSGARIASGATVGPDVVLGDNVTVEAGASILDSVIWSGAVIREGASVSGSVIGRNSRITGYLREKLCEDDSCLECLKDDSRTATA